MFFADKLDMKRIAFVFLIVLIPAFSFGQNKISLSHFWSIPWGTTMEQAEAIFAERGFESVREGASLMTFAEYEGRYGLILLIFNSDNRFYSGNVIYPADETNVMQLYEDFRFVLARRYGFPDVAVEFFEVPFEKGDGRELEAIATENAFFYTEWRFQDNNIASISILRSLDVYLTFRSPALADRR